MRRADRRKDPESAARSRRPLIIRALAVAGAAALIWALLVRTEPPGAIPPQAKAAARASGCGEVQTPSADPRPGLHLKSGADYAYDQHPATSGYHDPQPLPPAPHVYTQPVPETRAVHNLEHSYVLIYYRAGPDGLATEVVDAMRRVAEDEDRVIMAPYPALPPGAALALAAWNKLWTCPPGVTEAGARAMALAFVDAYRGTTNAPEAPHGLLGRWLQP